MQNAVLKLSFSLTHAYTSHESFMAFNWSLCVLIGMNQPGTDSDLLHRSNFNPISLSVRHLFCKANTQCCFDVLS